MIPATALGWRASSPARTPSSPSYWAASPRGGAPPPEGCLESARAARPVNRARGGVAVTAAAFIIFALASSFLFPRFWADYPGRALLAFIVVSLVFFFGMLSAVEVFGAESEGEHAPR